jgi:dolichol-phosphate mannosyltransferase
MLVDVIPGARPRDTSASTASIEASGSGAWVFALLALLTGLRLHVMTLLPLTGDEAYHWQWSRHLAFGYYDHPPMIAWSVALFEAICGTSLFSVRLAAPFFSALTTLFIYLLGREVSGSRRVGALSATLFMLAPLPAAGGMIIVPDAPMVAAWSATVYFLYRALFRDSHPSWGLAGVCLGLGIMSKLIACLLVPSLFGYLAACSQHRPWLRRHQPYLFVVTGLVVASPFLLWNATHGWQTFIYQATYRLIESAPQNTLLAPRHFLSFLVYQAAALSPVLFVLGMGVLAYSIGNGVRREPRDLFLGTFCVCILLCFVAVSFRTRTGAHWPFAGYLSLMVSMAWLSQRAGRAYRTAFGVAATVAATLTILLFASVMKPDIVFGLVGRTNVTYEGINKAQQVRPNELAEIYGYEALAQKVVQTVSEMRRRGPTFIITDSYTLSSVVAFYSGLETHVARGSILGREYARWDRFEAYVGEDALYIDLSPYGSRPDITRMLQGAFERVEPDAPLFVTNVGQQIRPFYLVRCRGFRRALFQPQ